MTPHRSRHGDFSCRKRSAAISTSAWRPIPPDTWVGDFAGHSRRSVHADGDDPNAARIGGLKLGKGRHLLDAGRAPGGPQVEQHIMALEVAKGVPAARRIDVPAHASRGVLLRAGDEICLGQARLRFEDGLS